MRAAASPFKGSVGFGYSNSCGRKTSNTFIRSAPGPTNHCQAPKISL